MRGEIDKAIRAGTVSVTAEETCRLRGRAAGVDSLDQPRRARRHLGRPRAVGVGRHRPHHVKPGRVVVGRREDLHRLAAQRRAVGLPEEPADRGVLAVADAARGLVDDVGQEDFAHPPLDVHRLAVSPHRPAVALEDHPDGPHHGPGVALAHPPADRSGRSSNPDALAVSPDRADPAGHLDALDRGMAFQRVGDPRERDRLRRGLPDRQVQRLRSPRSRRRRWSSPRCCGHSR